VRHLFEYVQNHKLRKILMWLLHFDFLDCKQSILLKMKVLRRQEKILHSCSPLKYVNFLHAYFVDVCDSRNTCVICVRYSVATKSG